MPSKNIFTYINGQCIHTTHINLLSYKHLKGEPLSKSFFVSSTVHNRENNDLY